MKYRPLYSIYSPYFNTKAMLQMNRYYAIKRVHRDVETERVIYHRTPVSMVLCLYPGGAYSDEPVEAACGVFLPLYPDGEGMTMGAERLARMLEEWVGE